MNCCIRIFFRLPKADAKKELVEANRKAQVNPVKIISPYG
jgi:hypothetical protein